MTAIYKYKQAMRWFTRPKVDPSIKQLASSLPYGSQETYGPPEVVPMPNMPDLLREEGIQVGEQVKDGGRVGLKPGGLVEPGVMYYGKEIVEYDDGTASYRSKYKSDLKNPDGTKKAKTHYFDSSKEARAFMKESKTQQFRAVESSQKVQANRSKWVKNFYKDNINKFKVSEYDKFTAKMAEKWATESKKAKYIDIEKRVRLTDDVGLPLVREETTVFDLTAPKKREVATGPSKAFYKRAFFKGKLETDKKLLNGVKAYMQWATQTRPDGAPAAYKATRKDWLKAGAEFMDKDVLYLLGEGYEQFKYGQGGGSFYDVMSKKFPKLFDKYHTKINLNQGTWEKNLKKVADLADRDFNEVYNAIKKENRAVKALLGIDKLPPDMVFGFSGEHLGGLKTAILNNDKAFANKVLNNVIGTTRGRNTELGYKLLEKPKNKLVREFNIAKSPEAKKEIVRQINELQQKVDPGTTQWKITKGKLDFDPLVKQTTAEKAASYKAELSKTKEGRKFLTQSIASQIRTMDGETIAQYKNIPEYEDCFNMQGGKNPIFCLTKKAENKPKEFARNSANIAKKMEGTKTSAQMINFLKKYGKLGRGIGWFAAGEAAFAPLIGIPMWAQGASKDEILHTLTWGAAGTKPEDKLLGRMSDAGRAVYKTQNLEGEIMRWQKALENASETGYEKAQIQRRLEELRKEYVATISMLQNPDTGEFNQNLVDKGFEEINEATTYFQNIKEQNVRDRAAWMTPKVSSVMEKVVDKPASAFTNLVLGPDWKKNLPQHPSSTKYPHSPATLGQHLSYDVNQPMFNTGGRVAFKFGGIDKGRRAFLQWLAGITGAGVAAGTGLLKFGKTIGKGKTAIKAGDTIIQGTPGMPDWYIPLINRIVKEGTDDTAKLATKEREIVHTKKIAEGEEVTVYQDLDTGNVRVEYQSAHSEVPIQMDYKAPQVIEEGKHAGQKTNPEFEAVEAEPNWTRTGPDDADLTFEGENIVGRVEDLTTDTSKLKEFGKNKKLTIKEKIEAKKKQDYRKSLEHDTQTQTDYIEGKYGPRTEPDVGMDEFGNLVDEYGEIID